MTAITRHKEPMSRLIMEGVIVNEEDPKTILNSRTESRGPKVARVTLQRGDGTTRENHIRRSQSSQGEPDTSGQQRRPRGRPARDQSPMPAPTPAPRQIPAPTNQGEPAKRPRGRPPKIHKDVAEPETAATRREGLRQRDQRPMTEIEEDSEEEQESPHTNPETPASGHLETRDPTDTAQKTKKPRGRPPKRPQEPEPPARRQEGSQNEQRFPASGQPQAENPLEAPQQTRRPRGRPPKEPKQPTERQLEAQVEAEQPPRRQSQRQKTAKTPAAMESQRKGRPP
jgi:hypothetical protein